MLKKHLMLASLMLTLSIGISYAQAPDTLWTSRFSVGSSNYGASVIQAGDGGYVITGITGNVGPHECPDLYLIKTHSDGSLAWQRTFGGDYCEAGRHISATQDGGYIIAGETESYGHGEMEYPDIYLLKVDSAGIELWSQTFDNEYGDRGECVEQVYDKGFVITGTMQVLGLDRLFILKTDSLGNEIWRRTYGVWISAGYSICPTPDHGYIIGGSYYDTTGVDFGGYLLKVDSLGFEQWCRHYDTYNALTIYCVQLTNDGGYIMTGLEGIESNFNIFLKKVSAGGDEGWTRVIDVGHWDWGFWAEQTADSGYVLAGFSDAGVYTPSDAYSLKTNADGETEWDLSLGGTSHDLIRCIHQTDDGGFICCGTSKISDEAPTTDIWLIRLTAEGTPIEEPNPTQPNSFALYDPYPNPFNASTTIPYLLPTCSAVNITVYNMLGQPLSTLINEFQEAGSHSVIWDGSSQASGIYFCRVQSNSGMKTGKITLLK